MNMGLEGFRFDSGVRALNTGGGGTLASGVFGRGRAEGPEIALAREFGVVGVVRIGRAGARTVDGPGLWKDEDELEVGRGGCEGLFVGGGVTAELTTF